MKLLKLELNGFKSFPKKIKLDFHSGITAIVGPNGCGKSNFVDAIRWVLGEQNPRILRAERMEDAIFKGTRARKPLGFAEVTITLSNENGELPISFSEVTLTRRLFRSGESQYLINKSQVRLKDITDLTSGTGIGVTEYSVIDQRLVDTILDDSTSRRDLIEEAAGIASYKRKRHLARRKLEMVDADLQRLGDIITEVERNVGSLGRHVKKARRFQKYRQRQEELDIKLTSIKLSRLACEEAEVTGKLAELETRLKEVRGRVEDGTKRIAQERESTARLEQEIREKRRELEASRARENELDGDLRFSRERLRLSRERLGRIDGENEELRARNTSLLGEQERIEERVREARNSLVEAERRYEEQREKISQIESRLADDVRLFEELDRTFDEEFRSSLREEAQRVTLREEIGRLMRRRADIARLLEDESGELDRMEGEGDDLGQEIEKLAQIVGTLRKELSEEEEKKFELLRVKDSVSRVEREKELALNNVTARIESMKREASLEGLAAGVHSALRVAEELGRTVWRAADLFTVNESHAGALSCILREYQDVVVTKDVDVAMILIRELWKRNRQRVSFVPLDGSHRDLDEISGPEGSVPVSALIDCREGFSSLRSSLFHSMFLVSGTADVEALLEQTRRGVTCIAEDGSFMIRNGIVTMHGDRRDTSRTIEELQSEGDELMRHLEEAKTELQEVEQTIARVEEGRAKLTENLEGRSDELHSIQSRVQQISLELGSKKRERERLREEHTNLLSILEEKGALLRTVEERLSERSSQLDERRELYGDLLLKIERAREVEQREKEVLGDFKVDVAALRSRLGEIEHLSGNLSAQVASVESEITARAAEEQDLNEKIESLTVAIRDLEEGLRSERAKIEQMTAARDEDEEALGRKRSEVSVIEGDIDAMRSGLEETTQERNDLMLRKQELDLTMGALNRRIEDEYNRTIDLDRLSGIESEEANEEDLENELSDIKRKIHYMGAVNMAALEEFKNEKERFDFLTAQRDDLLSSKDDLEKTIKKLNRTARELFRTTFQDVSTNFSRIFATLFRGGEAGLQLTDDGDPLESAVLINARPRGKKEQAIELLSGGERALAAIAFLFSLYLVKSSPFCIFDEVDAPLDDANILRFTSMLREYNEKTQFVLITHNKRTMEAADYMFGVSMEEPGVSKIVSIKLNGNGNGGKTSETITTDGEPVLSSEQNSS